jgi:hypothetical protein
MGLVRNLSIRVPWHDRAWDGHVCSDPLGNSSCLALKLIAENRKDDIEEKIPNEAFDGAAIEPNAAMPESQWQLSKLACALVRERDVLLKVEQGP